MLARTNANDIQRMRDASREKLNSQLLNAIINLFEANQLLYWINIRNPEEFIEDLSQAFQEHFYSTREIALIFRNFLKKGGNRIVLERDPAHQGSNQDLIWQAAKEITKVVLRERAALVPLIPPAAAAPQPTLTDYLAGELQSGDNNRKTTAWNFIEKYVKSLSLPEQINFIRSFAGIDGQKNQAASFFGNATVDVISTLTTLIDPTNQQAQLYSAFLNRLQQQYKNLDVSDVKNFKKIAAMRKAITQAEQTAKEDLKRKRDAVLAHLRTEIAAKQFTDAEWRRLLKQMLTVPRDEKHLADLPVVHAGRSVATAPLKIINIDEKDIFDKWQLILDDDKPFEMSQTRAVAPKGEGANYPGSEGNVAEWVYLQEDEEENNTLHKQTIFFKQPTDAYPKGINYLEMISEVMGATIMHAVAPLNTAAVCYAVRPNQTHGGRDQDIQVASFYFSNFMDINRLRTYPGPEVSRDRFSDVRNMRSIHVTYRGLVFGTFSANKGLQARDPLHDLKPVKGLGRGIAANLLVNNRQFHTGNNGIAEKAPGVYEFAFIDIGAAFRNKIEKGKQTHEPFIRAAHPHTIKGAKHFQNYLKDIPLEIELSKGYIEEFNEVARADSTAILDAIEYSVDQARNNFTLPVFRDKFAKELGIDAAILAAAEDEKEVVTIIKDFLKDRVLARQFSLREYALELAISGFENPRVLDDIPDNPAFKPDLSDQRFKELVAQNPFYFTRKRFHFRGTGQKDLNITRTTNFNEKVDTVLNNAEDQVQQFLARDLNLMRYPDFSDPNVKSKYAKENIDLLSNAKIKNAASLMLARTEFFTEMFDSLDCRVGGVNPLDASAQQKLKKDLQTISERLAFAVRSSEYDFSNEDDLGIVTQMCDEAYNQVAKALRAVTQEQQDKLIKLMSIEGDTRLVGTQLQLLKTANELVVSAETNDSIDELIDEQVEKNKETLGSILVDELLGIDRSPVDFVREADSQNIKKDAYETFQAIRSQLSLTEQKDLLITIKDNSNNLLTDEDINELTNLYNDYANNIENGSNKSALKNKISELFKTVDLEDNLPSFQNDVEANRNFWRALVNKLLTVPQTDPAFIYSGEKDDKGKKLNGIPPRLQGRNLAEQVFEIPQSTKKEPTCLALRDLLSPEMQNYRWVATKGSGAAGKNTPYGGWAIGFYRDSTGKIRVHRVLFKQDDRKKKPNGSVDHSQNAGEIIISRAFNNMTGDNSVSVFSAQCPEDPTVSGDDQRYIASVGYKDFEPIFETALKALGFTDIPKEHTKLHNFFKKIRSRIGGALGTTALGVSEQIDEGIMALWNDPKAPIEDLTDVLSWELLCKNLDMHQDNIGRAKKDKTDDNLDDKTATVKKKTVMIDLGGAAEELSRTVHPNQEGIADVKRVLAKAPCNHFTDFDLAIRISPQMAKSLEKTASFSRESIEAGFKDGIEDVKAYSDDAIRGYAKYVGIKLTGNENRKQLEDTLITGIVNIHVARQYSLREFALEIRLTRCFANYSLGGSPQWANADSQNQFKKLVKENPAYFLRGRNKGYHIRALTNTDKLFLKLTGEYKNFIYNHATNVLFAKEAQQGIRGFLLQDFGVYRTNEKDKTIVAAEAIIARLKVMREILKDAENLKKLDTKLIDLKDALAYFKKPDSETPFDKDKNDRKKLVIQVCDSAFREMANTYDLMPESSQKIHIYEVFKTIASKEVNERIETRSHAEQLVELTSAASNVSKYLADNHITISGSRRIADLTEEVDHHREKLSYATSEEEVDAIAAKIEKTKENITAIVEDSGESGEELLELKASAEKLADSIETEKAEIATEKTLLHSAHVEAIYHAEMKPIPIKKEFLEAASSSIEAAARQFQQAPPTPETSSVKMNGGKAKGRFFVPSCSTFYKDPTDEANAKNPDVGVTGFTVDLKPQEGQSDSYLSAQEFHQRDEHRLTYRIAKELLDAKSVMVIHKGFFSTSKESILANLITLKNPSDNEKTDALQMEEIVKECMEQAKIDFAKPLTDANAKKLFELLKKRQELKLTDDRGHFRSKLVKPEHIKKIITHATTSSEYNYANLPPLELMIYAKVWADRLAKFIKRKGMTDENGLFNKGKKDAYDPSLVQLLGSTNVNIPLIRSIMLAIAVRYDFKTKDLQKIHLSKYIKDRIHIVGPGEKVDLTQMDNKLLITSKDIQDAHEAYEVINNKKIISPIEPHPPGPAAAAA